MDPFADAQAWYDRGQAHIQEYRVLAYGEPNQTWALLSRRTDDGAFAYSLRFNRGLLPRLKPIACEAANALFQSLDNIIGAAARRSGVARTPQIAWPWCIEPDPTSPLPGAVRPAIDGRLNVMGKRGLAEPWLKLIKETFAAPAVGLTHIDVVKEVSLSGKHWELVATEASAVAVAWTPKGATQQAVADIPKGYFETNDEFIFHEGEPIEAPHYQLVTGTRLVAAGKQFQPEPATAFDYTSRFVATALESARRVWNAAPD